MKILFLDIDGVVNCRTTTQDFEGFLGIDPFMALLIDRIIQATGCKVVLSSSWRNHETSVEEVKKRVCELYDITSNLGSRGEEIKEWLDDYQKKFLEEKDGRPNKYAAAYLRSLYNAYELLGTGTFTVRVADTPIGETVRAFKEGNYTYGEVIDTCRKWEKAVRDMYDLNPSKETNIDKVNEFLLNVRAEFFNI